MIRPPPRSTRTDTLFPYTTLFRSSGIGSRALPGRPVAGGDASVGTAGRLAQCGEWLPGIGGRHALEAERGCGIEKAIRERAAMEGEGDAGQHDTRPEERRVGNAWYSTFRSRVSPYH